MRNNSKLFNQEALEFLLTSSKELRQIIQRVRDRALIEAKSQLHPLLRQIELERLSQRPEFIQAFKCALENQITQQIILKLPYVKAVYRFDNTHRSNMAGWDNTIHLLVLVPQLMSSIQNLGPKLDQEIHQQLNNLDWSRFQHSTSIVEIQQVTPSEIKHGIGYGMMFASFYAGPVQIWPSPQTAATSYTMRLPSSETDAGYGGKTARAEYKR